MANYKFITDTGVVVPDTADLRATVEAEWRSAFGDIDTAAHTPQGVMISAETLAREALVNNNAQLANQLNPNIAGGVFLDAICALMGIERRPAGHSVLNSVLLGGLAGTAVPQGTQFRDRAGEVWVLPTGVMLGSNGQAVVSLTAVEPGPIACLVGDLTEIFTPILGLETAYNTTPATLGYAQETDIELVQRRRVTLARQGISTAEAQISALMDIEGVTSVAWLENVSAASQTIEGIVMAPHSVWACVDGGTNAQVALALWQNKTAGAGYNGAVLQPIEDPHSGQVMAVRFDRPAYVSVSVEVTGKMVGDQSTDPAQLIPRAVVDWAAGKLPGDPGLTIGTDVSVYEIGGAINYFVPGFHARHIQLRRNGVAVPGNVDISLSERAIITIGDVTLVQI